MSLLEVEGVSKSFRGLRALDDVSLGADEDEFVGVIGPNGAGKTTLFGIVTGTVAPDGGRVVFEGHDITRMKPEHRCRMGLARKIRRAWRRAACRRRGGAVLEQPRGRRRRRRMDRARIARCRAVWR